MSKHTPGPWLINFDAWNQVEIISGNDRDTDDDSVIYVLAKSIGGRIHGKNFDDLSEVEANTHLIAASPVLLEAAQAVSDAWGKFIDSFDYVQGIGDTAEDMEFKEIAELRRAIALARGEA